MFSRFRSNSCCVSSPGRERPAQDPQPVFGGPKASLERYRGSQKSFQESSPECVRRIRRRGRRGRRSRPGVGQQHGSDASSHSETDSHSRKPEQAQKEKPFFGRVVRRFASVAGFFVLQLLCRGQLPEAFSYVDKPEKSFCRELCRDLSSHGETHVERFWLSRSWTGRACEARHFPRLGRTPVPHSQHQWDCGL